MRSKQYPEGIPGIDLTDRQQQELEVANLIVRNTTFAATSLAPEMFISIENPRGSLLLGCMCQCATLMNIIMSLCLFHIYAPRNSNIGIRLWHTPDFLRLRNSAGLQPIMVDYCRLSGIHVSLVVI